MIVFWVYLVKYIIKMINKIYYKIHLTLVLDFYFSKYGF